MSTHACRDVYADRRIPEDIRQHEVLWGECLSGALYIEDFKRICHDVGFADPREVSRDVIEVNATCTLACGITCGPQFESRLSLPL